VSLPIEAIEELPPETTGALTFHLPLEVAALELAGAEPAVVAARIERRLVDAYAAGLVDPPLYRWAVQHYAPVAAGLLSDDAGTRLRAFASAASLGDGLAGAAFHGLIRLGYGLWRRREGEVARGLAYLRTRRQVLAGGPAVPGLPGVPPLPPIGQLGGVTVFDLMNLAAGAEDRDALAPAGEGPLTMRRLAVAALALVGRNPSSFVSVHTVTGLHGLCELHHAVVGPGDPLATLETGPLGSWWHAYAVALGTASVIMYGFGPEGLPAPRAAVGDVDALVAAAVASGETHDVKLVLALRRLAEFGIISTAEVLATGAVKLAATECAAH